MFDVLDPPTPIEQMTILEIINYRRALLMRAEQLLEKIAKLDDELVERNRRLGNLPHQRN